MIAVNRNKAGIWGWRSDKNEIVNGHECKVFGASNVELVTKTRSEHLTEHDKARSKSLRTPLQNFLGIAEVGVAQSSTEFPKVSLNWKLWWVIVHGVEFRMIQQKNFYYLPLWTVFC